MQNYIPYNQSIKPFTANPILNTDSYKTGHHMFLNPMTQAIFSYGEARKRYDGDDIMIVPFGTQILIERYLADIRITGSMIDQAEAFLTRHMPPNFKFNRKMWELIVDEYYGRIPLKIRAVPEGLPVPIGTALITVEATYDDPILAGLGAYFETMILRGLWYGTTIATNSREFKKVLAKYLEETGDINSLTMKLVDFGARGVASKEQAEIGGAAHLVNFEVTDNLMGIAAAMDYYQPSNKKEVIGFSIPASEHSVTCQEGPDNEYEFYKRAIDTFLVQGGEGSMVSIVADTYDFENALHMFCSEELMGMVKGSGGTLVVRPDSGDPTKMVLLALNILSDGYGFTINDKGYKVLHPSVRIIQGDGIDLASTEKILGVMAKAGWSADNITFGSGGGLLQAVTRDTYRFAQKASSVTYEGQEPMPIRKVVKTDPSKSSKAGRLTVVNRDGKILTIQEHEMLDTDNELMRTVYNCGTQYIYDNFERIRERAAL